MSESFKLSIHVQPGARQTAIVGWVGDVLRVRIAAPPADGKANEALIALLANVLGVPKSRVSILRGGSGRRKTMEVEGLSEEVGKQLLPKD